MRRLLIALPILLLVLGIAAGAGYYVLNASNAPARTVAAADLDLESAEPKPEANSPLEAQPEPTPEPEPAPKPEPAKPIEAPKPDSELEAITKELEDLLEESDLSDDEKVASMWEMRKKLEEAAALAAQYKVTLKGRVVNHLGNPVEGASVMVSSAVETDKSRRRVSMRAIATTDALGNFEGAYARGTTDGAAFELEIYARSGTTPDSERQKLTVTPGEAYDGIVINLPQGAGITGRVVDSNFNPIEGARVAATQGATGPRRSAIRQLSTFTDGDGRFTIYGLVAGAYSVDASCAGYGRPEKPANIEVVEGEPTALASDLVLPTQTALKVKLVCLEKPVRGGFAANFYKADGTLVRGSGSADKDGFATIIGVPEDAAEMEIVMRGYMTTERIRVSIIAGTHSDIGEIVLTHDPNAKKYPNRGEGELDDDKLAERLKEAQDALKKAREK